MNLELLSPAGNADIAIEAIRHGADAVYIGPPSHGARKSVSNSYEDIERVVGYAHIFNARVYVTVNTLVYDHEIPSVERMIRKLYDIGVDALIVQDMGILRMDIPPIALHASTQCDIRTPEKARFLEEAGFSQLVLARELSISEIKNICSSVSIPIETFVHGALCVSYSGRCGAGFACMGRSGNRGECPQICRQNFTLTDASGKVLAKDKYLLSLKDFRAYSHLEELIEAGVRSFKIEGRLKEAGYVKNITAAYSSRLNDIVSGSKGRYSRSSYGRVELSFSPDMERSFNRGFTDYMLSGKVDNAGIASIHTPKSLGEKIENLDSLRPGDGISFFDAKGNFDGVLVNGIRNGKIIGNRPFVLPPGADIRRTSSVEWKKIMAGDTARHFIEIDVEFTPHHLTARDDFGTEIRIDHDLEGQTAQKESDYRKVFEKLGGTPFRLRNFENRASNFFYPVSRLTALKREMVEKLLTTILENYKTEKRRPENKSYPFPYKKLDYRDNVANRLSEEFYRDHGVEEIETALEVGKHHERGAGKIVMSSRHCILRELGLCLKGNPKIKQPLELSSGKMRFRPQFDCRNCEMHLKLI